jgi:hypothetical protein
MWGTWRTIGQTTDLDSAMKMVLSGKGYAFYSGPAATKNAAIGTVQAIGADQIEFGPNHVGCQSHGTYTWRLTDGKLYFSGDVSTEEERCLRSSVLVNYPWQKISASTSPAPIA